MALKKLEEVWTQQELLEYLKKILGQPETYSIKEVIPKLMDIESLEYYYLLADFFLNSETLFLQDQSNSAVTLRQVQQALVDRIPGSVCPLDSKYF